MNQYYRTSNYPYYRINNTNCDERSPLLPFLAGVLVTTPFIFAAKNNNQPSYYYPPPQQYPTYYPMQNQNSQGYFPVPQFQQSYPMPIYR